MSDQSLRGRFLWHELVTADLKAAGRFFTKIADWKTEGWDQNPDYQMFVAKTGAMGASRCSTRSRGLPVRGHTGSPTSDRLTRRRPGARPSRSAGEF